MLYEDVTIAETTEDETLHMVVQYVPVTERYFLDIQVGDISFTAYPTWDEIKALRTALRNL